MRRLRHLISLLLFAIALACSVPVGQLWETDAGAGHGGNASLGGASGNVSLGGASGNLDGSAQGCTGNHESVQVGTGLCVANMVPINGITGGETFSIDVTEVTKGQYDGWLSTNPALPTDATCSYVVSYAEQSAANIYTGTDAAHHPVVSVDWCDAYAYCNAVGKRLCGAIGGGANGYSSYSDVTSSQWFRACSSGNDVAFPYGGTFQGSYCNGHDYGEEQTVAVGSVTTCVTSASGFAGVYDLSGNVWEWEDSCSTKGQSAACHIRGGSFTGNSSNLFCAYNVTGSRDYTNNGVGFRCCST